jgi:carboxyl-terminal processing protease
MILSTLYQNNLGDMMKFLRIFTILFSLSAALTLSANWQKESHAQEQNEFGGIGIILDDRGEYLQIRKVLENSPAAAAGFLAGDILWAINDSEAFYWDLSDAVNAIRGEIGTEVSVTIRRPGYTDFRALLVRAVLY